MIFSLCDFFRVTPHVHKAFGRSRLTPQSGRVARIHCGGPKRGLEHLVHRDGICQEVRIPEFSMPAPASCDPTVVDLMLDGVPSMATELGQYVLQDDAVAAPQSHILCQRGVLMRARRSCYL